MRKTILLMTMAMVAFVQAMGHANDAPCTVASPDGRLVAEIAAEACDRLRAPIRCSVDAAIAKAEADGEDQISVSMDELQSRSAKVVNDVLAASVKRLIGEYRRKASAVFSTATIKAGIGRSSEMVEYTVNVPDWVPRDPEGLWENICAFFGKRYYRVAASAEKRRQKVDLGFDGAQARKSLVAQFERAAANHVRQELKSIRDEFFGSAMAKIDTLSRRVAEAERRVAECL